MNIPAHLQVQLCCCITVFIKLYSIPPYSNNVNSIAADYHITMPRLLASLIAHDACNACRKDWCKFENNYAVPVAPPITEFFLYH